MALAEFQRASRERLAIRAEWDDLLRRIDACQLRHRVAADVVAALATELDAVPR